MLGRGSLKWLSAPLTALPDGVPYYTQGPHVAMYPVRQRWRATLHPLHQPEPLPRLCTSHTRYHHGSPGVIPSPARIVFYLTSFILTTYAPCIPQPQVPNKKKVSRRDCAANAASPFFSSYSANHAECWPGVASQELNEGCSVWRRGAIGLTGQLQ